MSLREKKPSDGEQVTGAKSLCTWFCLLALIPFVTFAGGGISASSPLYSDVADINSIVTGKDKGGARAVPAPVPVNRLKSVNAKDFGAVGDGVTDDSEPIQAAFASISVSGGKVIVPYSAAGYVLNKTVSVTMSANTTLEVENYSHFIANGITEPTVGVGVKETPAFKFVGDVVYSGPDWIGSAKLKLKNMKLTNNKSAAGNVTGIYVEGFSSVVFEHCDASGFSYDGAHLIRNRNMSVISSNFSGNRYAGLQYSNIDGGVVMGGIYNNNGDGTVIYGYGLASSQGDSYTNTSRNISILGVTANGNSRKGIDFHAGLNVNVIGNTVIGFGSSGIYAVSEKNKNVYNVNISNNVVDGRSNTLENPAIQVGGYGLAVAPSGSFIIKGNTVKSSQVGVSYGVMVLLPATGVAPESVIITNNTITFGSSPFGDIVHFHANSTYIKTLSVSNNILSSAQCVHVINAFNVAENISILNNTITVDAGTVAMAILTKDNAEVHVNISGNKFFGVAFTPRPSH